MVTRRKTLNTLMLLLLPASTVGAEPALNALPGGATIVHGDASLSRQENTLLIEQQSDKAIIEWQNFDIGRDATVHFRQPGEQSSVLNRVNSLDASEIYGQLQANGQVVLVNPNGVVFGASARVDVGSLVVATLALEDRDFLNNDWRLSTTGKPGDIVNAGNIAADQVVMVAARMLNNGNISAGNGVVLASGDAVTITTDPAGLLAVDVSAADWQAAIDNKGVVDAGDGLVLIKTDVAQSFYQAQMSDMDKTAQAGVVYRDGESIRLVSNEGLIRGSDVVLDSGARGHSEISGDVTASNGGDIIVTGRSVLVESEARLTASGDDGGRILLGGSWQNTENIRQALHTVVESGSVLDASADSDGDGGMIVAWSDIKSRLAKTLVSGQLRAEGKGAGNIGGKIETSGAVLNVDGISVSTSDGLAAGGEWLLDPTEITIVAGSTDNNIDTALNPYFSTGSGSEVSVETIKTALEAGSDVTIETTTDGSGDIIWEAGADLSVTLSNDQTLTLRAADNIYFVPSSNGTYAGTDIEASGASLNLHFNPNRGADGKGGFYVTGNYWPGNPTHISHSFTTNGGDFLVFGGALFDDYAVGDATTSANRIGIRLDRATLTTGSGDILLKGMGGDNVGGNYTYTYAGIQLVETVMDTTAGNIQLLGSYNSRSQTNAGGTGIDGLSHASRRNRLQTVHGNIDITGYAYSPIDSSNFAGYKIGSSLISTDYGEIRIFGEAPVAWGNNRALGVYMNHTGATITSGIDGVAESGGDVFIRGLHHLGDTAAHTNISLGVTDFYVYGRGDLIMQSSGRLVFGGSTTQIMVDNDVKLLAQDIHLGSLRDPGTYGNVYNPGKLRVGGSFHAYYTRSKTSYAIHPTSFDVTQPQLNCAYGGLNAECATGNSIIEAEEIIPGHLAIIRSYDSSANSIYDLTETQRNDLLAKNDLLWQLDTATSQYVRVHETDLTTHITQHTTLPQSSMQNTQTLYLQTLNGSSAYGDAVSLGYTLVNAQGTEVDINALGLSVLGTIAYAGAPLMGDNVGAYDYRYGSGLILRHATDNYMLRPWSDDGSWTITPRELSLSDLTGTGKIYDGSSDAIVNYNTANLSGLLTGEDVQLSHTASFSDANAGTNKSITVQFQLSDGSNGLASNYSLADQSVLADIAPRDLTISGSVAQEKTYDGSTAATITAGTLSGLLPGDTLSVIVNGSYATANAGSDIAVSPSYQLLDGSTLASNYVLTNSESLTADIQPRLLDIEFTTLAKTWDGTDSIEVQALPSGLIAGENLTLAYDARLLQTDAGDQVPVLISDIVLSGSGASNYQLQNTSANLFALVMPAVPDVVFPGENVELDYGQAFDGYRLQSNSGGAISYRSSDTSIAQVDSAGQVTIVGAGDVTITAIQAADGNYAATEKSYSLDVSRMPLTLDFESELVEKRLGDGDFSLSLVSNSAALPQWQSSDPSIVRVNADGSLSVLASGEVQITASIAQTNTHDGGAATFNISVVAPGADTPASQIVPQLNTILPNVAQRDGINFDAQSGDVSLVSMELSDAELSMSLVQPADENRADENRVDEDKRGKQIPEAALQASAAEDIGMDGISVLQQADAFLSGATGTQGVADNAVAGSQANSLGQQRASLELNGGTGARFPKTILLSTYGADQNAMRTIQNTAGSDGFRHVGPISAFTVEPGRQFRAVLPGNFYQHSNPAERVTLSLSIGGNKALPNWMSFDPEQRIIRGVMPTRTTPEGLAMTLSGQDESGNSFAIEFILAAAQELAAN